MLKPKTYHGRMSIECTEKKACPRKVGKDVLASCISCGKAITTVLGPEFEVLATLTIDKTKTKKGAQHGR